MVFLSLCPFPPFSCLFSAFGNPDRLCHLAANLHKVEPLSTFEAHDTHETQEAHNAPLTMLATHRRQLTLKKLMAAGRLGRSRRFWCERPDKLICWHLLLPCQHSGDTPQNILLYLFYRSYFMVLLLISV